MRWPWRRAAARSPGAPPSGMVRGVRGDRSFCRPTPRGGARDHGAGARGIVQHTGVHRGGVRPPGRLEDCALHRDTVHRHHRRQVARGMFSQEITCIDWLLAMDPFQRAADADHYAGGCARQASDDDLRLLRGDRSRNTAARCGGQSSRADPCNGMPMRPLGVRGFVDCKLMEMSVRLRKVEETQPLEQNGAARVYLCAGRSNNVSGGRTVGRSGNTAQLFNIGGPRGCAPLAGRLILRMTAH